MKEQIIPWATDWFGRPFSMAMIKKILDPANWKKTYFYLKKNGVKKAVYAALERIGDHTNDNYTYTPPSEEALSRQREACRDAEILFSILVPVYCTPERYFEDMLRSVLEQTYPNWELLLGDASPDDRLGRIVSRINDSRIRYIRLKDNSGISGNTNVILRKARGSYIGLLDHDDLLTPDALFEVYRSIQECGEAGGTARLIYSDEDKCDQDGVRFYDPNLKPAFDQDYLWSNNYICHFTVLDAELMKKLEFLPEYDGAQDYDLVLRACREICREQKEEKKNSQIHNISKVLYHWRCHTGSTAVNPQSKLYAYEAGKRAVEQDLKERRIIASVDHSAHLGFYRVEYEDIFRDRPEAAMVAGPVYRHGRIAGGALKDDGTPVFAGLRKGFSGGHLHKAAVRQRCTMADFENADIRPGLWEAFLKEQGIGCEGRTEAGAAQMSRTARHRKSEDTKLKRKWADYVHRQGMILLYDPEKV